MALDPKYVEDSRWPRDRVRAKARYARLFLDQLRTFTAFGDDRDYAYEEACLAHLDGAVDAFLQEVNVCHRLGLDLRRVHLRSVRDTLFAARISCREFDELTDTLNDQSSWLAQVREFRNQQVHRAGVSRTYRIVAGSGGSSRIELRDPKTQVLVPRDRIELFQEWIDRTDAFFERLGASLRAACGLPQY